MLQRRRRTSGLTELLHLGLVQETLRKYSVVPVVTRRVAADDKICGMRVPGGTYLACCLQAVHATWQQPASWSPERFLPGGEYDHFPEDIRPFMVRALCNGLPRLTFCACVCVCVSRHPVDCLLACFCQSNLAICDPACISVCADF